jgi:branched-chain amino acid transport system substrate-binding protein
MREHLRNNNLFSSIGKNRSFERPSYIFSGHRYTEEGYLEEHPAEVYEISICNGTMFSFPWEKENKTMIGRLTTYLRKGLPIFVTLGLIGVLCVACGGQSGATTTGNQQTSPIRIGISLSLSGDFAADGQAFEQGYQLWADNVNAHGGLLGRKVVLDIVSDASSPDQVQINYQKLITIDKVDLVVGPYSTLLTKPASLVANQYGYAMIEGAGGGPSVFNRGLHNVFDVSLPIANNLVSFAQYVLSLPASMRPKTAAYATEDDPFTEPQVDLAKLLLEQGGVKTVSYQVYPSDTADYTPIADNVVISGAQMAVFGTQLPDISAFIGRFKLLHYNPRVLVATAGPDQGNAFLQAIGGTASAEGIIVPNGWYPQARTPGNTEMVNAYLAKYGGTADQISADVAEAYSVGQVAYQAITKIKSLDNAKIIAELRSGDTFETVQGPVKFDNTGQNIAAQGYLFQWQKGVLLPVYPVAAALKPPEYPKANWP